MSTASVQSHQLCVAPSCGNLTFASNVATLLEQQSGMCQKPLYQHRLTFYCEARRKLSHWHLHEQSTLTHCELTQQ